MGRFCQCVQLLNIRMSARLIGFLLGFFFFSVTNLEGCCTPALLLLIQTPCKQCSFYTPVKSGQKNTLCAPKLTRYIVFLKVIFSECFLPLLTWNGENDAPATDTAHPADLAHDHASLVACPVPSQENTPRFAGTLRTPTSTCLCFSVRS